MVFVDPNANITDPEGNSRGEAILPAILDALLEDISVHFLLHKIPRSQGGRTWSMLRQGMLVRSITDKILGIDCHLLQNISTQDPRRNAYYSIFLGCLLFPPVRSTNATSGGTRGSHSVLRG